MSAAEPTHQLAATGRVLSCSPFPQRVFHLQGLDLGVKMGMII